MQSQWPDHVIEYYESLAERRGWDQQTVDAFVQTVEHIRLLAAETDNFIHLFVQDDQEKWWFECASTDAGPLPIRQIVDDDDGHRHKYSWERLEDEWGGLSEMTIDESHPAVQRIDSEAFETEWQSIHYK